MALVIGLLEGLPRAGLHAYWLWVAGPGTLLHLGSLHGVGGLAITLGAALHALAPTWALRGRSLAHLLPLLGSLCVILAWSVHRIASAMQEPDLVATLERAVLEIPTITGVLLLTIWSAPRIMGVHRESGQGPGVLVDAVVMGTAIDGPVRLLRYGLEVGHWRSFEPITGIWRIVECVGGFAETLAALGLLTLRPVGAWRRTLSISLGAGGAVCMVMAWAGTSVPMAAASGLPHWGTIVLAEIHRVSCPAAVGTFGIVWCLYRNRGIMSRSVA